ncbi:MULTISPECIES: HNH endonuclease signature motif containing protein [Vibrio]|uniref:HNH endonuclease n=1 Tax=Vibrio TaxID=662 RepID=UPI0020BEAC99|nr:MULTISPECIES: HNH endonuclease signature motif containing protein [Vibrio]MDW1592467.1 HNH endonuclease signature motif containing protein [Vibrio sp. Vb2944]MDW1609973.1 HNH endonuclease signature motif containing protein [Vibrio sp. Vb2908]MDW1722547.1 HNH endonuclease signature motif containing protein [Vibrio sp. Vb2979]MDW1725874.1 HNH endonuclease signature motif containing protein [Vibrio sp. Vb2909]MDW1917995.1 HNH endonuclease signature motif containing protein [Vibrio sp. Vb0349]
MGITLIIKEIERRQRLFNAISYVDIAIDVKPSKLRDLGIYGGAAGVWVNSDVTRGVVSPSSGVAVSILHTGKNYSDNMSSKGIDYDFPNTNRNGSHDQNEIQALKNCFESKIPLFVISKASNQKLRNVHIGLVQTFDEINAKAFIRFVAQDKLFPTANETIKESQAEYKVTFENEVNKSLDDSSENRQRRLASRSTKPKVVYRLVQDYRRDPDVVAEALYRAEGFCEKCKEKAPFIKRSNGEPYLEVHHIIPLSQGGLDSLENVISLCPNCHREIHFGPAG